MLKNLAAHNLCTFPLCIVGFTENTLACIQDSFIIASTHHVFCNFTWPVFGSSSALLLRNHRNSYLHQNIGRIPSFTLLPPANNHSIMAIITTIKRRETNWTDEIIELYLVNRYILDSKGFNFTICNFSLFTIPLYSTLSKLCHY